MRKLNWYLKRLSVMGPAEIVHRVGEQLKLRGWRLRHALGAASSTPDPASLGFCTATSPRLPNLPWRRALPATDPATWRRHDALGFGWSWSDVNDIWHLAPDTGRQWPRMFFGAIHYRAGNPHGDARVVWEPSRLQQLVDLARRNRDPECADREAALELLRAQLVSWVEQNPPMTGIHYVSAMECGLRLIAVCHALDMVREALAVDDPAWQAVVNIAASHGPLIVKRISQHSSAGNHTIAECAGVVYAGVLFPELPGAQRWIDTGIAHLRREAERQVLPDGGGLEQAFHYHLFILDLLALVEALLQFHGRAVPAEIASAIARGKMFLGTVCHAPNALPAIGDSDNGYALSADLAMVPLQPHHAEHDAKYPDAGYTVVHRVSPRVLHLVFDHGPLGMPPSFGHGHGDTLSLFLALDGEPQLIDPGTFTYTGDPDWRRHFRGTRAHNTVMVDGEDAACQQSAFQWSSPFAGSLLRRETDAEANTRLLGHHDGYARLGVGHARYVAVLNTGLVVVIDQLDGVGEHELELNWHLPATVTTAPKGFAGERIMLHVDGGNSRLYCGDDMEKRGWEAPVYGQRVPATCVSTRYHGALPHGFRTVVVPAGAAPDGNALNRETETAREWLNSPQNA